MTKAMTAAMIGELVAEGKMDWDKTPVIEYVPEAKFSPILTSELTLTDYLSHRTVSVKRKIPHHIPPDTPHIPFTNMVEQCGIKIILGSSS